MNFAAKVTILNMVSWGCDFEYVGKDGNKEVCYFSVPSKSDKRDYFGDPLEGEELTDMVAAFLYAFAGFDEVRTRVRDEYWTEEMADTAVRLKIKEWNT